MTEHLAKRLFEALTHQRGCRLTADEVEDLLRDDAVATAVANAAAESTVGADCFAPQMVAEQWTWKRFCEHMGRGS